MTPRRRVGAAACGVIAVVCTACAIPTQSAPSTMSPSKVPFGLLDRNLPTTTTTQPKPSSLVEVKVFFVNATTTELTPSQRYVSNPAPLSAVLDALMQGPSHEDTDQGLLTAIPSGVRVLSASGPQNKVTVNMNSAFDQITGNSIELAVAQIVATIAAENGCSTGVLFEVDGIPTGVPIANGQTVPGPVMMQQFASTLAELGAICP